MPVPANARQIWDYLRAHGLSANAAAGILGNIEQESGGNPGAGSYPGSWGLIQWTPATAWGVPDKASVSAQLPYILKYIEKVGSIADINAHAHTPQQAALWFSQHYERPNPAAANNSNRMASAVAVLRAALSGHWRGGAGGKVQNTPPGSKTPGLQQGGMFPWPTGSGGSTAKTMSATIHPPPGAHNFWTELVFAFVGVGAMATAAQINERLGRVLAAIMFGFLLIWFLMHDSGIATWINSSIPGG